MPVEHLWQWLREDLTYHICYDQEQELISAVANFQHLIKPCPSSENRSFEKPARGVYSLLKTFN